MFVLESLGPGIGKPEWYPECTFTTREIAELWLARNGDQLEAELRASGLLRNKPGESPFRIIDDGEAD